MVAVVVLEVVTTEAEAAEEVTMAVAVSGHTARATRDRRGKKERAKEERKKGRKPWSPVAARTAGVEHAARRYNAAADPSDKKWRSS